ncbi:MAG: hypothetical protein NTW21_21170 [Verrucomicrobia bacterium]|nr:hypothetical protein [Verrucomicrobiota bacterium]
MNANPDLLTTLMELPEAERFEIAMAILDRTSPAAMEQSEILQEAARRQDEMESGVVRDLSYEELLAGIVHRRDANR